MSKALIIIDAINAIINPDKNKFTLASCSEYLKEHPKVTKNINTLIEKFRAKRWSIIFVNLGFSPDYHDCPDELKALVSKEKAFMVGTSDTEVYNLIHTDKDDKVFSKTTPNPFVGTNLENTLKQQNLTELALVGFATHNAIQKGAVTAKSCGFSITVISDACGDRSDEYHANALLALKKQGIALATTNNYLSQ